MDLSHFFHFQGLKFEFSYFGDEFVIVLHIQERKRLFILKKGFSFQLFPFKSYSCTFFITSYLHQGELVTSSLPPSTSLTKSSAPSSLPLVESSTPPSAKAPKRPPDGKPHTLRPFLPRHQEAPHHRPNPPLFHW